MISALLLLGGSLTLIPISPVSTYSGGLGAAAARSTGWRIWNSTSWQHTSQSTISQRPKESTTWQHSTWAPGSNTYTHTITFTHSSTTITDTFTHSLHTFSTLHTATSQVQCDPSIPGYPYNCYQYQIVTTVTEIWIPTYSTPISAATGGILMTPAPGVTAHDIWLLIEPVQGGEFEVILNGQGLQQDGNYLIEGVTRTQMIPTPLTVPMTDSEFVADANGNGLYWHVLSSDPRLTYGQILLLYLPGMQTQESQLIASAYLD